MPHIIRTVSVIALLLLVRIAASGQEDSISVPQEKALIPVRNVDMSFQMRGSLRAEMPQGEKASAQFRMDDLRWNIEGKAGKKVYYRFRQAFTNNFSFNSIGNIISSVNYAFVKWNAMPEASFTFGKHVLALGGHEFDAVPVYVIHFSDFGKSLSSYQSGVSAEWHINPAHDLIFQVCNFRGQPDSEFYYAGLPDGISPTNFPFICTVNWNGDFLKDRSLKLRYSASYGHQAENTGIWILSLGHSYKTRRVGGYIDLMWSRQGIDVSSIMSSSAAFPDGVSRTMQNTEYLSAVGYAHFFINRSLMAFVKGVWECAGIYRTYRNVGPGICRTNWNAQACLQYMPTKDSGFRLFAHYNFYNMSPTGKGRLMGISGIAEHTVSLGIIYIMKVL